MKTTVQFRELYRLFLFRLMDVEMLAASARGDSSGLLGQCGALLIFGSVLLSWCAVSVGQGIARVGLPGPIWTAQRFLLSLNMLVVGVFALLSWDSTLPDRRDVFVLAPLPIRARTLFAAKIAAASAALGLVVAAWNCLAGFAWPMVLTPGGAGFIALLRCVAAFWITLLVSGAFLYCALLTVQGIVAQLPRGWYLRVSSVLQISAFMLFLGVICFQPTLNGPGALAAPENQRILAWLPTYWFLGLLSELNGTFAAQGHAVMAPLAQRAVAGLVAAAAASAGAFLLSYVRTLKKIVEEPDVVPSARGGIRLPRWGPQPQSAVAQFAVRTLVRSRQHRMVMAFYLGGGFAIVAVYLEGARQAMHLPLLSLLRHAGPSPPVATILILCAAWLGARTVFSLPLDLRANWLFRITPAPSGAPCVAAARRALLAVAVLPTVAVSAVFLLSFWPWPAAVQHLLLLALAGSVLVDTSLNGFRKIPFTCSYLPGKSKVHMIFWFGIIPLVVAIHKAAGWEQQAMSNPLAYALTVAALFALASAARILANRSAAQGDTAIQFEQPDSGALIGLDLNG